MSDQKLRVGLIVFDHSDDELKAENGQLKLNGSLIETGTGAASGITFDSTPISPDINATDVQNAIVDVKYYTDTLVANTSGSGGNGYVDAQIASVSASSDFNDAGLQSQIDTITSTYATVAYVDGEIVSVSASSVLRDDDLQAQIDAISGGGGVSQGYVDGQIASVSASSDIRDDFLQTQIDAMSGGGTFDANRIEVSQTGHGFTIGTAVRLDSDVGEYVKARADLTTNAEVYGLVSEVIDVNNFAYHTGGIVSGITQPLTAGLVYYLDPEEEGLITATDPSSGINKPVLYSTDTDAGLVLGMRGFIIDDDLTGQMFLDLEDTPTSYIANNFLKVNAEGDAIIQVDISTSYVSKTGDTMIGPLSIDTSGTGFSTNADMFVDANIEGVHGVQYEPQVTNPGASGDLTLWLESTSGRLHRGDDDIEVARRITAFTPSGTSDTAGDQGDIACDDNYFYYKTSTGWKRVALGTW